MPKYSNQEAQNVEAFASAKEKVSKLNKELRQLNKLVDELKPQIEAVVNKKGSANSADHHITCSIEERAGYEVKSSTYTKFNITEK
jgi:ADP-heptose:LPS heptosyltransferase